MPESNGIVQVNPMNNTHGKHTHNYSSFPDSLAYKHYMTLRFGEYTPTFVMDGEPKDEISLNTRHLIDSLSLNAPFKGTIRKITESFMVPKMAVLPRTWDLIYTQPSNGDDAPKDANCVIQNFPNLLAGQFMTFYADFCNSYALITGDDISDNLHKCANHLMRMLIYGEYFFSAGSLLSVCGYHGNNLISIFAKKKTRTYDAWFDLVIQNFFDGFSEIHVVEPVGDSSRIHYFKGLNSDAGDTGYTVYEDFRAMIELFRENPRCYFSRFVDTKTAVQRAVYIQNLFAINNNDDFIFPDPDEPEGTWRGIDFRLPQEVAGDVDVLTDMSQLNLNLSRILAYQLVCAHFYSNSAIDFVYTADLYRNYVYSLFSGWLVPFNIAPDFEFNSMKVPYDYLSGHFLKWVLFELSGSNGHIEYDDLSEVGAGVTLSVCSAIFAFRKSLRFGDYFVGSRPRPLAPINTDISVNSNMVSVIDVTRSIQAQRFANSVMRSRSKIENYVRDLFGKSPAPDFHNPFYLTRQAEIIFGDEVQNTAETQVSNSNSRTANFKSGDSRFTFTFHNDDAHPCVYLQIVSFDIKRAYTRSVDRHFMHLDRFDMFNPDFQYIGDQPVYGYELGYTELDGVTIPSVFGYQGRDMEYKQRFDVASGGFVENLPGWILTDLDRSVVSVGHLDPDFIRSYNTELDQFFLSLNGFSLASYFHFVCVVNNNVSAKRAMAVDPQILE